jgi:hypothetical protein
MNELERPLPDSMEQDQDAVPDERESGRDGTRHELPLEADEADAADQERELGLDEDDYR